MFYSLGLKCHYFKELIIRIISGISPRDSDGKRWRILILLIPSVMFLAAGIVTGISCVISIGSFIFSIWIVLWLCSWTSMQRTSVRNILLFLVFTLGVVCYYSLYRESKRNEHAAVKTSLPGDAARLESPRAEDANADSGKDDGLVFLFLSAVHHSNDAISAFFPSRGSYIVSANRHASVGGQGFRVSKRMMCLYELFHVLAYVLAGYFVILLWGARLMNRLRFWLTLDSEKNVFWCTHPTPKMLCLARSIRENAVKDQVVFSVDEFSISDLDVKALFQEMNYHKYCLKLRKPTQIHESCLRAGKNYFLTDDVDWNIKKGSSTVSDRENMG